jgi:hypothetical protein
VRNEPWGRKIFLAIFYLGTVALFPGTIDMAIDLNRTAFSLLFKHFGEFRQRLDEPHAGEEHVLAAEVLSMLALIRKHHLPDYMISGPLAREAHQRIVESAWSIKLEPASRNNFFFRREPFPPNCRSVDSHGEVRLVVCP